MKTRPDSQSAYEDRIAKEFEKLGLDRKQLRDDEDSPEVDRKVLEQLADRKLDESPAKLILQFIACYKNWREAYCEILVERFNASKT